jgi:hypothetical protein
MERIIPLLFVLLFVVATSFAQGSPAKSAGPFAVEYSYKVKWGRRALGLSRDYRLQECGCGQRA